VDLACEAAWDVLTSGGTALQAVLDAVMIMEDDPRLNAGTGGRVRDDGSVQLDAAVATSDGRLGMVMVIEETPNPVLVAAELLDEPYHALAGEGARTWADSKGIERTPVVGSPRPVATDTVGAIARDRSGALAVASSTGGCTGRPAGRVGDTPMWGSGLWCDANIVVAATGIGESIIEELLAYRVAAEHQRNGGDLGAALDWGINQFSPEIQVGLISLDAAGGGRGLANTGMPWAAQP
jgi:isoaspartyl peptidase/L-asparaginase-like protein (Ntn-hydrolase superfamily)